MKKVPAAQFVAACDVAQATLQAKAPTFGVTRKFVDAILAKGEAPATGEQGAAVMQLMDGIYKSCRLGKEAAVG